MPASLALAVSAFTAAAAPPFSAIALTRAASASAMRLSIVTLVMSVVSGTQRLTRPRSSQIDAGRVVGICEVGRRPPVYPSTRLWIIPERHAPHCYWPRRAHARGVGYSASPAAVPRRRWLRDHRAPA